MKRFLILILLALAGPALAQEIVLTVPETRPAATKLRLSNADIKFSRNEAVLEIEVTTAANERVRYFNLSVPNTDRGATFNGLLSAMGTIRAGESGGAEARANFRILGFLRDRGYPEVLAGTLQ